MVNKTVCDCVDANEKSSGLPYDESVKPRIMKVYYCLLHVCWIMSTCVITMHAKCNVFMSICNIIMMTAWHISYICFLFVCLFVYLGLSSHLRIFHSYGDVTIAGEGLQILTYARHSWPLSSEGSLTSHTYCDTGHPFIMVISDDPWHSHLLPSV